MKRRLDTMVKQVGRPHNPDAEARHVQAIRRLLYERRMSMRDLANAMGASRQTISALMQGQNVTLHTLQNVADALRCDISELFPRPPEAQTDEPDMAAALLKLVNMIAKK